MPSDPDWAGGSLYVDERTSIVDAAPTQPVAGDRGHRRRERLVLLGAGVAGPGLARRLQRRARAAARPARTRIELRVGDAVDWWRVEEVEPTSALLRLRAEMRLPGLAWLDLAVDAGRAGRTVFRQKAWFHPRGLLGQLYWWSVTPFHGVVFGGMQRNIARAAEEYERTGSPPRWRPPMPLRQRRAARQRELTPTSSRSSSGR